MKSLILNLLIIASCTSSLVQADSPNSYAQGYIIDKAKDCGDLKYGKDATKVKTCIFEKLTNIENFYAWFWFKAGDSTPATGLILKEGELSITWFDKVGKGKETYFLNYICEDWNFDPNAAKPVQCTMKKSNKTIYLLEMDSFVELKFVP
jgi:hypothetical protein